MSTRTRQGNSSILVVLSAVALLTASAALGQQYSFEIFQFPGASITTPKAINNHGQIVGIVQGLGTNMGFFKDGSSFSLISVPGAGPLNGTVANGINDNAQVVGTYTTENTGVYSHGFVQTGQTITPFDVPGGTDTEAYDINNLGQIVGRFFATPALQIGRGFIKDGTNFTYFDAPGVQGPAGTMPYGINDSGQIVGEFLDSTGFHSFLYQSNQFSLINVPQSNDTHVYGINNSGQMAGSFRGPMGDTHGFITIGGRFFQVDVPGVQTTSGTSATGINDSGQVVGSVSVTGMPGVADLGFVATPCSGADTNCLTLPEIVTPPPTEKPDLAPLALQIPATITGPPYVPVTVVWGGTNQGTVAATNQWFDSLYLSSNSVFNFTATTELAEDNYYGTLAPGTAYRHTNTFRLPLVESGNYYFFLRVDTYQDVSENNKTNNILGVPFTFSSRPPDLAPLALQTPGTVTAPPYPEIPVVSVVTNQGGGDALGNPYWWDAIYFSTNSDGSNGTQLSFSYESGPVIAGGSYWRTNTLILPVVQSGTYYLVFTTDFYNNLAELNTNNNGITVPITVTITPADLAPLALQVPSILNGAPRPKVTLIYGTTNQGIGAAHGAFYNSSWYDALLVSTNPVRDSSAMFVQWDQIPGPLPPGAAFLETNTVRLPIIESGNYFLLFQSDAQNDVYESNENNNVLAVPFTFNAQPPDLTPVALQAPPKVTSVPYPTINVVWGVLNQGLGEALPYPDFLWLDQLFLSTSNSPDGGTLLDSYAELGPVPPGGTYWRTNSVQLPVTQSGLNYLVFKANANNAVLESTTNNNTFIVPVTLTITPPDLAPVAFEAPSAVTAPPYPMVTMVWGITNQGTGPAIGSPAWSDELFISTKPTFDYSATSVSFFNEFGPVAPGTAYWRTNLVTVPVTSSGTYYLFLVADVNDLLHDGARGNNMAIAQVIFNIQPPDLTPSAFVVPSVVSGPPNPKMLFSWMVTNIGSGAALRQWSDQVFFSAHSNLDWTATSLLTSYEGYPPVLPGGSYQRTRTATVPVTQSGQYYFFFQTDTANSLYESNTANNIVVAPVAFHIDPPDLSPILLQAPAVIAGSLNPTITLTYAVTNQGVGAAVGLDYPYRWYDQLFVSTNSVLDGSEILVGNYYGWSESGPIAPGSAYWRTRTVQLPLKASGNYFLLLYVNASQTLFESSLSNNVLAVPIGVSLQLPDLAPLALVAPSLVSGPPYPVLTLAWGITNQGPGEAPLFSSWPYGWVDAVYLSTNTNLDLPGTWLASTAENGPLASGTNYWRTNVVTLPITNSGTFYLVLRTDDGGSVPEVDENNNTLVMPITFQATGLPDLVPLAMQAPPVLTNYALVTVVTVVTNEGSGTAQASPPGGWQDTIFISQSPAVDSTARFVTAQYESGPLLQGATYRRTNFFYLPPLEDGDYFFIFQVNAYQGLAESNLGNNILAVPFSFHLVAPDLAPVALQAPAVVDASPFPTITVIWGITNQGPGLAVANGWSWYDSLYISTNADTTGVIAYGSSWSETNSVPAGGSYWRTNTVQLPVTTSGNYYLVFETDSGNYLQETNLANNIKARPITFNIHQPDLAPVLAQVPAEVTGPASPFINVSWAVTNSGTGTAGSYQGWVDTLFISTNNVLDSSAFQVWWESETNTVPAGGLYWHTSQLSLPVQQTGTYYLFFVANNNEWLTESDYSNNVLTRTVNVTIQPPDLAPLALVVPDTVTGAPWPNVTVVVGVTNGGIGTAPAFPGWQDGLYLSAYPFLDDSSYPFFTWSQTNAVPPGSIYWTTNTVRMPVVDSATLYLIFKADAFGQLNESDEGNNSMVAAISFDLSPTPNLVPLELLAPPVVTGSAEPTVTLAWRVANQGLGPTAGQWFDRIYLSPYRNINWNPQPLLSALITNSLAPGADYWHTNSVTLRNVYNGTYFFVLAANSDGGLFETDTADNFLSVPVQIDLTVPPAGLMIAGGRFLTNGTVQLEVYGPIGSQFTLQASTNLLSWVVISNFTMVAAPTYVVDPQASSFQQRFYRLAMVIPPRLSISRTATSAVVLSWPLPADGWVLEQASSLVGSPHGWTQIPPPYPTDTRQVWVTITNSEDISFYRLRLP